MRLSIVTPSFNQGHFIGRTIQSMLLQPDGLDIEFIIVDGGSKDNTVEVVESYRKKIEERGIAFRFISEPDEGQSDAINKGSNMATGELLTYLNSDDYYEQNVLGKVIEAFEKDSSATWGYGGWNFVDYNGRVYSTVQPRSYQKKLLHMMCTIIQPSAFYRKDLFKEVGMIDKNLHLSMDYDLWLRMAQKHDAIILPFVVSNARYYLGTKSATNTFAHLKENFEVQRRYTKGIALRIGQLFYYLRGFAVILLRHDLSRRVERKRAS